MKRSIRLPIISVAVLILVLGVLPRTVKQVAAENIANYYAHYRMKDNCIERISLNFVYDYDGDGIPFEGVEFEHATYSEAGTWQSQHQLYQLPQMLIYEDQAYTYIGGLGDGSLYTKQGQIIEIEWPGFSCQLFDQGMIVVAVSDETDNSFVSVGDILWLEEQPGDKVDTLAYEGVTVNGVCGGDPTWVGYEPEPSYMPGDVNGDGVVNAKDVTTLRRYLAGGYGITLG